MTTQIPRRDKFYIWYFIVHIFISIAIDSWIALPSWLVSDWQQRLAEFHIASNGDLLFASRPAWLQTFVWVELLLQVPFFAWAAYDLSFANTRVWPAVLVYGVEAACTTLGCIGELVGMDIPLNNKLSVIGVYLPTFFIPFAMVIDFWRRLSTALNKHKQE